MKNFAVILAGCGVYDGSEIHEATLTLYAIKKLGAQYTIFAPDIEQHHVINHLTGADMNEQRNVLVESARIARGAIKPLTEFDVQDFDAILLPGGFGVAKNLSTFAFEGANCKVNKDVETAIRSMHTLGKPIGALCISPVILARIIGRGELTIGHDANTAALLEQMGITHKPAGHGEVIIDRQNKIFSTPCYMLDADIVQIADGVENIVRAILKSLN